MIGTIVDLLAGMTGGIAAVFIGQPLDTVKTNMQVYPNLYKNMFTALYMTGRQQGIRGLYAGTIPALLANSTENAVMFASYSQCQSLVANISGDGNKLHLTCTHNALAGSIASLLTSLVLCPTELVKIRKQGYEEFNDVKLIRPTISLVVKNTISTHGWKGLYRGLYCTLLREFIGNALFFGTYERCREKLKPNGERKENCDPLATMASGSIAGLVTWFLTYPIDVVKSRVQISNKEWPVIQNEIQKAGLRGLYSGLFPTLVKTVPVTGILLFSVEFSKPVFRKILSDTWSSDNPIALENKIFSMYDFISGWVAGVVSTIVGHPMDTVRVVQQVTNTSALKSFQSIYNEQKFPGFYRGMMFPICCTGIVNSVLFGTSGNTMRFIQKYRGTQDIDVRYCCDANNMNKIYWHFDTFMAGCVGGFFSTAINIPSEVIKTILQASNISSKPVEKLDNSINTDPTKITSPIKLIVNQYKTSGLRSLYRGTTLLMMRDVPSMGVYFLAYEHLCCVLKQLWYHSEIKNKTMPKHIQLIAGGLAGVTSWIVVLPFDVIKTKIIVDSLTLEPLFKGSWDCAKKTYAQGGVKIFFRGFWLLCIRAFPVNGIAFLMYGLLMEMFSDGNEINKGKSKPAKDDKIIQIPDKS